LKKYKNGLKPSKNGKYSRFAPNFADLDGTEMKELTKETIQKEIGNIYGESIYNAWHPKTIPKALNQSTLSEKGASEKLIKQFSFELQSIKPEEMSLTFSTQTAVLKSNLPTINGKIDLRFLKGDLDDPEADSPTIKEIMKYSENCLLILLGTSGVGKTKTLFDIAKKQLTVLFDFSTDQYNQYFLKFCSQDTKRVEEKTTDTDKENRIFIKSRFFQMIISRLILLIILKNQHPKAIFIDVCTFLQSRGYQIAEGKIAKYLYEEGYCNSANFLLWINELKKTWNVKKVYFAFDEVNVLFKYKILSRNTRKYKSLFSAVSDLWFDSAFQNDPIVIAGTYLKMKTPFIVVESSTFKPSENKKKLLIPISNFRCLGSEDSNRLLNRLIDNNLVTQYRFV